MNQSKETWELVREQAIRAERTEAALALAIDALKEIHGRDFGSMPWARMIAVDALEAVRSMMAAARSESLTASPNPCQEQEQTIAQLRVQLAGCAVAAQGANSPSQVARPGDYGWSPAYQDVLDLRARFERVRALVEVVQGRAAAHGEEVKP